MHEEDDTVAAKILVATAEAGDILSDILARRSAPQS